MDFITINNADGPNNHRYQGTFDNLFEKFLDCLNFCRPNFKTDKFYKYIIQVLDIIRKKKVLIKYSLKSLLNTI